jgi:hypothetical protein
VIKGDKGKDGLSPKIETIVAELKKQPIEYKDVKGAPDLTELPKLVAFLKAGGFRGGGSSGGVSSVTNSDGTLTISPTTGPVVASLNLAKANTWTNTQTFNPSSTGTKALVVKAKAGSSVNSFEVQDSSGNPLIDVNNAGVFQMKTDMQWNNIAGGTVLGLTNGNITQGINSYTNIVYNAGLNLLKAYPSGGDRQYQFNEGGTFQGTTYAKQTSDGKSRFFTDADSPIAPANLTGTIHYGYNNSETFTTGYAADAALRIYRLYTEKTNPTDGSLYYSPMDSSQNLTDNNSKIQLDPPTGANHGTIAAGSYAGENVYWSFYAYADYNGKRVYSTSPTTTSEPSATGSFNVICDPYTFNSTNTAYGFLVLRSVDGAVTFDSYQDFPSVSSPSFNDDGITGWLPIYVTNVTASQGMSGSYVDNGDTRNYQVYGTFTVNGAPVYTFLSATTSVTAIAQAGFTDSGTGLITYGGDIAWTAFTPPADMDGGSFSYMILRQVNGSAFSEFVLVTGGISTVSFVDTDDSLWSTYFGGYTHYTPATPIIVPNFFQSVFTWDAVAGASGYKILKSEDNGSTYVATSIGGGSTTTFTDTGTLSWADSTTVTPNIAGPFGVVIGGTRSATFTGVQNLGTIAAYPNNAAALAGGLVSGDMYRTGGDPDLLCIVQ